METPALRAFLEARLPATLALLRELVEVNSHTANPEGVNRQGRLTAERFAPLGFSAEFVPHAEPGCGEHLIMTRPGRSPRTVALISHLDTVFSREEERRNNFRWQPEGDRIYGPGTVDIKGGTAMMHLVLAGLAETAPEAFADTTWMLFWDASEETLSRHFADACLARLDPAVTRAALVFEGEGRPGGVPSLVAARKGRATFSVHVEGRASHAGAKHARGANAIVQLGRLVDRIAALTDYARHLTFNVGTIEGGIALNRVPHAASAGVEMRAFSPEVYRAGVAAIQALAGPGDVSSPADGHRCAVRVELTEESPPWPRNPRTDELFQVWSEAARGLGQPLGAEERGGLSDGNWIWERFPTLDGLGPYGDNDHCSERSPDGSKLPEYLEVPSVVPKALLNVRALERLLAGDPA